MTMMTTPVKSAPQALSPYEQGLQDLLLARQSAPQAWPELRTKSLERFQALGIPTKRLEAWKYIDLKPVLNTDFQPYEAAPQPEVPQEALEPHLLAEGTVAFPRLVFVNGALVPALCQTQGLPQGVVAQSLGTQAVDVSLDGIASSVAQEADAFAALNGALFQDGAFVSVPDGVKVAVPLQLLFLTTGSPEGPRAAYLRNVLNVGKNAALSVVLQFVGVESTHVYLNNVVNHLNVDVAGQLEVTLLQAEAAQGFHFAATHAQLQANSQVEMTCVAVGGQTSRHHSDAQLLGEGADCRLNGLSVLAGETRVYRHIAVEHQVPNTVSRQLFKSIVDDRTRSEFDGTIVVYPNACGTDAEQMNKNLLLSDDARVYTRPQLRIDNDDVKCAHGATVGQLEDEELFYLFSRGLSKEQARSILTYGFAEEILGKHTQPALHAYLDTLVLSHLNA